MTSTSTPQSTHEQTAARFTPRSEHGKALAAHRDAVIALAAEHDMSNVRVFGSTARGTDRPDSDIDLLVDIGPRVTLFTLACLEIELQRLLGIEIDVVQADAIKPRLRPGILKDAVALRTNATDF